jgi:hypothetical protein
LTGLLWSVFLGLTLFAWPIRATERTALLVIWIVKCCVCLGVMLAYESHYGLDAFNYFEFARDSQGSPDMGVVSGTDYILWLTSMLYRYLPSYHAIKSTYSYVGLIGVFAFYRSVTLLRPRTGLAGLYLLGLWPTILFWSSILGKDPIVFLGVGLYCLGVVKWQQHRMLPALLYLAAGGVIVTVIRVWFGVILAVPMVVLSLLHTKSVARRIVTVAMSAVMLWIAFAVFHDRYVLDSASDILQTASSIGSTFGIGGASSRAVTADVTTLSGFLTFLPIGMFTALFRPLPGEVWSIFGLIASAEDAILLALLVLAVVRFREAGLKEPIVIWALTLVLVWSAFYAVVSYQNFGAALRYKLSIIPVLLLVLIELSRVLPPQTAQPHDGRRLPNSA